MRQRGVGPAAPAAIAVAEADIAATRERLDRAVAAARHDLVAPLAAAAGIRAMMGRTGGGQSLGAFLRQNAAPIGLVVVGLAWLGLRNRDRLNDLRRIGGAQFLEAAQTLGKIRPALPLRRS